jgi:6-phosphogluconolactonase
VSGSPFEAASAAAAVAIDPTGTYAYVTNAGDNSVSAFTINGSTGALTKVQGSPFSAGSTPYGVAVL